MRPYKTAHTEAKTERIINRSRFISQCFPVRSEDEALSRLNEVRKQYPDATHVCYAYRIGELSETTRFSDAGEPSGTAGMPILEVLKANELTYVLCTVTRYFGGVLLGAGGLVRAYTKGAVIGLDAAKVVVMHPSQTYLLEIDYSQLSRLEHWIKDTPYRLDDRDFAASVTCQITLKSEYSDAFHAEIARLFDGRYEPVLVEERFMAWEE